MTNNEPDAEPSGTPETAERHPVLRLGTLRIHGSGEERRALFSALAKAQAGYQPIRRTRTVTVRSDKGNYDFDYAPLEEVISATQPSMNAAGLAWLSLLADEDGTTATDLHTLLTHEGGAFVHVVESLPPVTKAQERGSQITYRRRYQYQCVTGTSPEVDDDGNAADGNKVEAAKKAGPRREPPGPAAAKQEQSPPPGEPSPKERDTSAHGPGGGVRTDAPVAPPATKTTIDPGTGDPCESATLQEIATLLKAMGILRPEAAQLCKRVTGIAAEKLDQAGALRFVAWLKEEKTRRG